MPECFPDMPRYTWKRQDGSWYGAELQGTVQTVQEGQ
jgi:hypothetical protein